MTRDLDLLRRLLLDAEAGRTLAPDVPDDAVNAHIRLLEEARFVLSAKPTSLESRRCSIREITWNGCEVLDIIRDDSFWQELRSLPPMPFDLLLRVAYDRVARRLNISG